MSITSFSAGFITGFGTGFVTREIIPVVREIANPIFKVSTRAAIKMFERSREIFAYVGESVEDIFAEVQDDMKEDRAKVVKHSAKGHKVKKTKTKIAPVSSSKGLASAKSLA
jgi:hypothetical protein